MSARRLVYIVGSVTFAIGAAMLVPTAVALGYQEWSDAGWIALSAAVVMSGGGLCWRLGGSSPGELTTREGFAAVALSWFAMSAAGTLPYLLTGALDGPTNAFFETAAGFTTTGSSVVSDPSLLGNGILLWRALTQWMGGMGIIVLSVAILPLLGVGGLQLARAESPGVHPDRLTPRFRETAKRLWLVYVLITAAEVVLLVFGDMSLFESVAHSFTTMSTGGFSTSAQSLGGFSAYSQWVVITFMALAGVSFALHFRALQRPREYVRDQELRLFFAIMAGAAAVFLIGNWGDEIARTVRDSVFTAVSLVTTTGYATADFGEWTSALRILAVGLMFVGGMAGSTAGAVKVYRLGVLTSASRADLRRLIHPRGVFVTRLGHETVPDAVTESVQSFFLLYMFLFMTGTLAFGMIVSITGSGLDLTSAASAVASALGNIGPGLGDVGPASNYLAVPALGKWLLGTLMIVGRLEIFPVLLLFTRELWKR